MNRTPAQDKDAARLLRRLLVALSEPGARAAPSGLDDETIAVHAPRKGVTVVRARLPAAVAEAALSEGLAEWERDGATRRLRLTEAGRAFLRRAASGTEMEPFRAQHGDFKPRTAQKGARPTLVNEAESPLAWLARRKGADGKQAFPHARAGRGRGALPPRCRAGADLPARHRQLGGLHRLVAPRLRRRCRRDGNRPGRA